MVKDKKVEILRMMVEILKVQPGGLWIREIARQIKQHPETVRRVIKLYPNIFEEYADLTQYNINLKFVRLTPNYEKELRKITRLKRDKHEVNKGN